MIRIFLTMTGILLCVAAKAGGALHLQGKIKSFDETNLVLTSADQKWTLARAKLAKDQGGQGASIRSGQDFDAWISFDAVTDVK